MCNTQSNPSEKPSEQTGKFSDQLRNYVLENFLSVMWSFFLAVGGVVLLIHFWSVGYFPNSLELESATALLGAIAITGIGLVLLMATSLILPGLIYLAYREKVSDESDLQVAADRKAGMLVGLTITIATAFILGSSSTRMEWQVPSYIFLLVALVIWFFCSLPHASEGERLKKWGKVSFTSLIVWVGAFLPLFVIFLMMAEYEKTQHDQGLSIWFVFFEVVLLMIVSNVLVAISRKTWWFIPFIALMFLMVIMLFTQQWKIIPEASVRLLKLGDVQNASLLLDQEGCQIACSFGVIDKLSFLSSSSPVETNAAEQKGDASEKKSSSETCFLRPVKILSRIGQEFYLEAQSVQGECAEKIMHSNASLQFTIPSSHVLSWSVPLPASGIANTSSKSP